MFNIPDIRQFWYTFALKADQKRLPTLAYGQFFVIFFGVFYIVDYDSICSEADFSQEKSHFHPTSRFPIFALQELHS